MNDINTLPSAQRSQSGFTLVELLIAMTLGLVLVGGLVTVFQGNKRSAALNNAMANMQENARYVFDTLSRDARMAGFQGCVDIKTSSATISANNAPTTNFFQSALTGSRVTSSTAWTPAPPVTFDIPDTVTPVIGSDVLSLQFANQEIHPIQPMGSPSDDIVLSTATDTIEPGDLVIVSNCQVADLVRISAVNGASLKHDAGSNGGSGALSARYGQTGNTNLGMAAKFESNVYFLADTGRLNQSGDNIISLYRQTLPFTSAPQELVEGVELLRIKYGARAEDSDNMTWGTAADFAGDFTEVQSLQIGLLMQSYERLSPLADKKSYYIAGDLILPEGTTGAVNGSTHTGDRRFRLAFNTTINIRNRR